MANIDVISLIFESFALIRARYREVAVPLMALLLLSGAGHVGNYSLSDLFSSKGSGSASQYNGSPLASSLSDSGALMAGLAGVLLIIIAIVAVVAFVISVLRMAVWFYVSEHFHAILVKKKITKEWQQRMRSHLPRAFVMALFEFILIIALILAIAAIVLSYQSTGLVGAILLSMLLVLAFICLGIFLAPAWIYYAIDRLPFFQSLSRSLSLVRRNFVHFLVFAIIFFMLDMGSVIASFYACCFSFLLMPVLIVFFALLSRVTLIKMKLAIEKQESKRKA